MRAIVFALIAFFSLAGSALAADPQHPPDDHSVAISPVALPVVVNGEVVNYVFVTAKVMLSPGADEFTIRDKEPFFRDALVRDAYRTPFVVANDYNRIDEGKLRAVLLRDASAIAGAGNIRGIVVVSQTAQHFVRTPHAAPF
jgi:hypothetical protein